MAWDTQPVDGSHGVRDAGDCSHEIRKSRGYVVTGYAASQGGTDGVRHAIHGAVCPPRIMHCTGWGMPFGP